METRNDREARIVDRMVEVDIHKPENFLIIRETLTRVGIASLARQELVQSCHILAKGGKYYIAHFKLLMELDGKVATTTEDDIGRQNTIARLLEKWGLCTIVHPNRLSHFLTTNSIKIIRGGDKHKWKLVYKHRIGDY